MKEGITLTFHANHNSLIRAWENVGYSALSILVEIHTNDGNIISIELPNGRRINQDKKKELDNLFLLDFEDLPVTCDLVVCVRKNHRNIVGIAATLTGTLPNLITYICYGMYYFPLGEKRTIQNCLNVMSNDYSIIELVTDTLGLKDLARDEAPLLMNYPSLSIIIPGYGVHETINNVIYAIQKSIENLCTDDIKWECLIIDDNNEIPLSSIMRYKEENHIKVIRSEQRLYSSGARNLGIQYATGELILFLDGDTMLETSYFREHLYRHVISENLITVSLREYLDDNTTDVLFRRADISKDTRVLATYYPDRIGLIPVKEPITVEALKETDNFRAFGFGRKMGPIDLPFMVKGNNLMVSRNFARILFPPHYIGYGPEDIMYAAKAIARGCMVVPILTTGVFHINHSIRSGSVEKRDQELRDNLIKMQKDLSDLVWNDWGS